jgi:hypothetical protein
MMPVSDALPSVGSKKNTSSLEKAEAGNRQAYPSRVPQSAVICSDIRFPH